MQRVAAVMLALLFGAGVASAAPVPINLGPGQPQAYAWQADESWPGGNLADSRLDRPVHLWRAGLSLPEVCAGIDKQTGVAISIWPPQDPLARLRVNLYLNDAHPPTLREVMAQLSWAVRASFACTEGPERRYFLLGTGEVTGAYGRWMAEQEAHQREVERENRKRALAELERARAALDLPREEAIARYRGKDDALLLTLLDPEQRQALRVLCSLSREQLATLEKEGALELGPADLTPEQSAILDGEMGVGWRAHVEAGGEIHGMRGGGRGMRVGPAGIGVSFTRERGGAMAVRGGDRPVVGLEPGTQPDIELEVRRLLGEVFTEPQEQEFRRTAYQRWARERQELADREARARLLASQQLSAAIAGRLEGVTITWKAGAESVRPLWRVQEAVAKATGLNVVSDCFTAEPRQFVDVTPLVQGAREARTAWGERRRQFRREHQEEWLKLREAGRDPEVELKMREQFPEPVFEATMRDWLTALCYPGVQTDYGGGDLPQEAEGWEWGDAGSFLRFRSAFPEVWRGAMLPGSVERVIEEAIQPYLKMAAEGTLPKEVPFPLDLRTQAWIVSQLDGMQLRVGPSLARDDPSTAAGQLHNGLVTQVVMHLSAVDSVLRFLATLRGDQWEALEEAGLDAWDDLTPEQRAEAFIAGWAWGAPEPEQTAAILRRVHLRLFTVPGKGQPRLGVRGPEETSAPQAGIISFGDAEGGDMHQSEEGGETCFDFSAPLETGVAVPPAMTLSRKE